MAMLRQSSSQRAMLSARMTPEREELLNRRLTEAISQQPELGRLKELLLHLGGEFVVAPPKPDQDVPMLLERGFLMSGPILFHVMKSSSCHRNVASVWLRKEFGIVGIATGYALSDDGLWRQHSWGILRNGVLETTQERLKYFGLLFQGKRADFFADSNSE
jgi:hypothetical protein